MEEHNTDRVSDAEEEVIEAKRVTEQPGPREPAQRRPRIVHPRAERVEEAFSKPAGRPCLKADGTVDYVALTIEAILPLAWNGYILYLQTKKLPGGISAVVESSATPEQAMERLLVAMNTVKETLNAARSA